MAQTGYTPILIYSSSTVSQAPAAGNLTNSTLGSELAINITDGKLFYKDNANAVQVIAWKVTPTTAGGTGLTSYTAGDLLYYATGTTLSKLAIGANTTVLTSSGTAPQWTAQSSLSVGTAANLLSNATTGVMQIVGPGAGTTRVMTIPNANFTAARTDAGQTFTGNQTINGILDVIFGTGDQLLINAKTNDGTAANNAGVGLRANSSATAANRFAQLWFDADGANLSGGDYFLITKNGNNGTADLIQYSNASMQFAANYIGRAAIDLTIGTTGNITFNTGNLIQGTAAKGINFTANTPAAGMTSQLLNWYEEGTWTPTDDSGANLVFTNVYGYYTRTGDIVTAFGRVTFPVTASALTIVIGGLPFTVANNNQPGGGFIRLTGSGRNDTVVASATTKQILFYANNLTAAINSDYSNSRVDWVVIYKV